MSIYTYTVNFTAEKLLPPLLRTLRHLAWLRVLMAPIQNLIDRFTEFRTGAAYAEWSIIAVYVKGDRVRWANAIYEALQGVSFISPTGAGYIGPYNSADYWLKVQDNFIGAEERLRYNSQIIVLEYALNRWFSNPMPADQIYIANNDVISGGMMMAETGTYSSFMAGSGVYAQTFMMDAFVAVTYDFTVWVPVALFATLGTTADNRENAVRQFVDQYRCPGLNYNVDTF